MTTLFLASDHGGFTLKSTLIIHLKQNYPNFTLNDLGTYTSDRVDYPDFGQKIANAVLSAPNSLGIGICGTGIGINIAVNRFKGIRSAVIYNEYTAKMAKEHNNANIVCLGERTTSPEVAIKLIDTWMTTQFEEGRHQIRINKLDM